MFGQILRQLASGSLGKFWVAPLKSASQASSAELEHSKRRSALAVSITFAVDPHAAHCNCINAFERLLVLGICDCCCAPRSTLAKKVRHEAVGVSWRCSSNIDIAATPWKSNGIWTALRRAYGLLPQLLAAVAHKHIGELHQ